VQSDIDKLYEFTLPEIRNKRISNRDDEPELTKNDIRDFVKNVHSGIVVKIDVEQYHEQSEIYLNCPAAVVVVYVKYNESEKTNKFKTIWVLENATWYSTSLNKRWHN